MNCRLLVCEALVLLSLALPSWGSGKRVYLPADGSFVSSVYKHGSFCSWALSAVRGERLYEVAYSAHEGESSGALNLHSYIGKKVELWFLASAPRDPAHPDGYVMMEDSHNPFTAQSLRVAFWNPGSSVHIGSGKLEYIKIAPGGTYWELGVRTWKGLHRLILTEANPQILLIRQAGSNHL